MTVRRLVAWLKALGFKRGDCSYCGEKSGKEEGQLVMVKKLPNRVSACYLCYNDRQKPEFGQEESDG